MVFAKSYCQTRFFQILLRNLVRFKIVVWNVLDFKFNTVVCKVLCFLLPNLVRLNVLFHKV